MHTYKRNNRKSALMKNYYHILNIPSDAPQEAVKKAYIALAKRYHPDTTELDIATASRLMSEINEAYEILGDTDKRKLYDNSISYGSTYNDNVYVSPDNTQAYNLANTVLQKQLADFMAKLDYITAKNDFDNLYYEFLQSTEYTYNRLTEENSCDRQTILDYKACKAKFVKVKATIYAKLTDDGKYVKKELYIPIKLYNTLADKGVDIDALIKEAIEKHASD